jgi:hypothetical protein
MVKKNILILNDFPGGCWDAVCFTMKFLRNEGTNIYLLQTYHKSEVRHTNIRDIAPILQKISIDDLEELRSKILNHFEIPKRKVKSLSIEGILASLLQNQLTQTDIDCVVVGLYSSIPNTGFLIRRNISRIIRNSSYPLFILPYRFSDSEFHKIVFITDTDKQPSTKVLERLRYLESLIRTEIHILFVTKKDTHDILDNIKHNIIKHLSGIKVSIDYLHKSSTDVTQNYQDLTSGNLVVIEKNNYQIFRKFLVKKLNLSFNSKNENPVLHIIPDTLT